jgi:hypothetical protein
LFITVAAVLSAVVSRPALAVYVVATGGDGELAEAGAEPAHEAMMPAEATDAPSEGIGRRLLLASRFNDGEAPRPPAIARPLPLASASMEHDDAEGRKAPTRLHAQGRSHVSVGTVERQRIARYRSPRSQYHHCVPPAVRMCAWSFSVIQSLWRFQARHRLARPQVPGQVALGGRVHNRHGHPMHKAGARRGRSKPDIWL